MSMTLKWKKKNPFHWRKKHNHVLKEVETKVKDLGEQSENEIIEDQLRLSKDGIAELNFLKTNVQQMNAVLTAFEQAHRSAHSGLQEFAEEIKTMANEKTLTMEESRDIEAKIVCLKNLLVLEESNLQMAKIINKFQFGAGISKLERKIKEKNKISSSFSNKSKT